MIESMPMGRIIGFSFPPVRRFRLLKSFSLNVGLRGEDEENDMEGVWKLGRRYLYLLYHYLFSLPFPVVL